MGPADKTQVNQVGEVERTGLSSSLGLLAELMIRHYEQFHSPAAL